MSKFDSPYVIVPIDKLSRLSSQNDIFTEKVRKILKRTLIRAGSIPYVHTNMTIVQQQPTMLVGIRIKNNRYEVVATLNKELSLLHTVTSSASSSLIESLCECFVEFKIV